jgi:hypothetical protein
MSVATGSQKSHRPLLIDEIYLNRFLENLVDTFLRIMPAFRIIPNLESRLGEDFRPFFSTRSEGSGLGLAISYQIVHEHGGFIDLESEVGKGTSFRVHLPLSEVGRGVVGK